MQGDKMIPTDLFEFAYVPDWYGQLDELAEMALPEPWRFRKPAVETRNTDTPILERYINIIFRKQTQNQTRVRHQNSFTLRMNMPAYIPDFTIRDTRQFTHILNAIRNGKQLLIGISVASAMKYHQN